MNNCKLACFFVLVSVLASVNLDRVVAATSTTSPVQTSPAPTLSWIRQFGTPSQDGAQSISAFRSNVYVAGYVTGALPNQTALGGSDSFLRSYDNSGNTVWTRQFGTSDDDGASTVYADSSGVYVSGEEGGNSPLPYVTKYSQDGSLLWTQHFSAPNNYGSGSVAAVTADGTGVYVVGRTVSGIANQAKSAPLGDAYIIKFGLNGTLVWAREFGGYPDNGATGVSFDPTGVYVSGFTWGTLPGQAPNFNTADGFVRKYDVSGNELWTRQFSISDLTFAESVSAGGHAVYVAGETLSEAWVSRYTTDGTLLWTDQFGNPGDSASIVFAGSTGVYVAGGTYGNLTSQPNFGQSDIYVQKFDFQGNSQWIVQMGTTDIDIANGLAVDGAGGIYLAGRTLGVFPGQMGLGSFDAFVIKLSEIIRQISVSTFFTDANQSPLPTDSGGTAKLSAVLSNGIVRATNPGQLISWAEVTNTGSTSLRSIQLNETLPVDWTLHPSWLPSRNAIHVYFAFPNGTMIEITNSSAITVRAGNPTTLSLTISDLNATIAKSLLMSGDSIQASAQLSYELIGKPQSFNSYPRLYTVTANSTAWTQESYSGAGSASATSGTFILYVKVVGDVNGDGRVDLIDAGMAAYSFGSRPGDARWYASLDFDNDSYIGLTDVSIVYYNYGNHA